MVTEHYLSRVPPFGDPGIKAYLQLPQAFRSLSRPSSAISALASTLRSYSLDLRRKLKAINLGSLDLADRLPVLVHIAFLRLLRRDTNLFGFVRFFLCSFQGANQPFP